MYCSFVMFLDVFTIITSRLKEKKDIGHDDLIKKIIDIINSEYMNQSLFVDSISDTLEMSPSYITRIFKQYTTKTILDYIIEVRMKKARDLLENKVYSISEIAEKTGFSNSSYFYKAFKRENGVTPNEYRKNS